MRAAFIAAADLSAGVRFRAVVRACFESASFETAARPSDALLAGRSCRGGARRAGGAGAKRIAACRGGKSTLGAVSRRKTPWVATLAVAALAVGALLGFATVNVALIVLRRREPSRERPFRVPGSVGGIPVLPALGVVITLLLAPVYLAGAIAIALSAAVVFAGRVVK